MDNNFTNENNGYQNPYEAPSPDEVSNEIINLEIDSMKGTIASCYVEVVGEVYGELPVPEKEGYKFDGWVYSQQVITEETVVVMTGEHILTARWIAE